MFNIQNFRVNWNAWYDKDHYNKQEEIYKKIRPTLLANTLTVPKENIRDHVTNIVANKGFGITQQVEGFYQTNTTSSNDLFRSINLICCYYLNLERQSTIIPVDTIDYLRMHDIVINQINNNKINMKYLVIEGD